jgi:hypothetical protein
VNKSRVVILSPSPVILSEAKNLRSWLRVDSANDPSSCFWSSYLRRTAEMLRWAQHDRVEFFHTLSGIGTPARDAAAQLWYKITMRG